jgi:hypothetical protein
MMKAAEFIELHSIAIVAASAIALHAVLIVMTHHPRGRTLDRCSYSPALLSAAATAQRRECAPHQSTNQQPSRAQTK